MGSQGYKVIFLLPVYKLDSSETFELLQAWYARDDENSADKEFVRWPPHKIFPVRDKK
jgi:hypothetical protein